VILLLDQPSKILDVLKQNGPIMWSGSGSTDLTRPDNRIGSPDFLSKGRPENKRGKRDKRGKGLRSFAGCRVGANEAIA
jgi:hypothetical protein